MPSKMSELPSVSYTAYVLGDKNELINGRAYRHYPELEEQAEQLARFNFPRKPEHHGKSIVVVITSTRVNDAVYTPTQEELQSAMERLDRRRPPTLVESGPGPTGSPTVASSLARERKRR